MKKHIKPILSLVFAICLYLFWALSYRAALSYQEQFQLFLLSKDYFLQHLSWPGGLTTYCSEFGVQFFNNYWIGALIIAILLTAVQLLTYALAKRIARKPSLMAYVLSFVPAIALWIYMGDINHMPAFALSIIFALLSALWFACIKTNTGKIAFAVLAIPAFFWLAGSTVYLFAALMTVNVCFSSSTPAKKAIASVALLAYVFALPLISATFVNYPLSQILIGINYYRLWDVMPMMLILTWSIELVTVIGAIIATKSDKLADNRLASGISSIVVIAFALIGIRAGFDAKVYTLVDYDYLLRTNNWDAIIKKAETSTHHTPLSVCTTNLALGMKNQLNSRAFEFVQNGVDGLIPSFQKDANSTLMVGEIYFQLGLINTAQRFAFEAMEANSNFKKSSRCIKRLVETNIMRGNYAVAEKYLNQLDKTLFYSKWAKRMRALIDNPIAIETHPLYGRLKGSQIDDSFLFSEMEIDKILGQLFLANPQNQLATQYLLMYPLLQRDMKKFMQYLEVVQQHIPYVSPITQQGVAFAYMQAGQEIPQGTVDPATMRLLQEFAMTVTSKGKNSQSMDKFLNTLWYYLIIN